MEEQRLIELEMKMAHQEIAIEELQKTVFEQHQSIEKLEKTIKKLTEHIEGSMGTTIGPGNQKPPHY